MRANTRGEREFAGKEREWNRRGKEKGTRKKRRVAGTCGESINREVETAGPA